MTTEVRFQALMSRTYKDKNYYTVDVYDPQAKQSLSLGFTGSDANLDMAVFLSNCEFGDIITVNIAHYAGDKNGQYRLGLVGAQP